MRIAAFITIVILAFACGCSGGPGNAPISDTNPLTPSETRLSDAAASHTNWGLWQFTADPAAQTLDVVMLRTGAMHLNVLPFVDMPPLVYLTLETLQINGNIVDTDIGLRHPFLGLVEFTGFDVKGILVSDGSIGGFTNPALLLPGDGDTRMLNADGYSRWWNPAEFPDNGTIFGYNDGVLGTPDSVADFTGILNGYKYFCDDIDDPDDELSIIDPEGRGVFSPGQKNVRHYTIELGDDGLIFNYAVDASWQYPQGDPPWEAPADFAPAANQPEAYRIEVTETDNTLYYTETEGAGGELHLQVDVYDWYNADLNTVYAEWPGILPQASSVAPVGGGVGYSTYEIDITNGTPAASGEQSVLITVESDEVDYQDLLPGETISSYFIHTTTVADEPPFPSLVIVFSDESVLPEQQAGFNDISPALCVETDGDIKMAYNSNQPIDYAGSAYSYSCKSNDGLSWGSFFNTVSSWGGMWACHGDAVKIYPNRLDNSWRTIHLYSQTTFQWATPFTTVTEPYSSIGYDSGVITTYIDRMPELLQDADGYIYLLGDRNHMLQFKKSEVADYMSQGASGSIWQYFPIYNIGTGYFSRARSAELAPDGTMYFVYYVDDTANTIRLAYNTDSTGLTWDTSTIAYNGASTGTSGAHDPGMDIDEDNGFHVTLVRHNETSGNDELCYIHSTDGSSWSNPVIIAENAGAINDNPISIFDFGENQVLASVWKAGDHIYISFSVDAGATWYEATQVDSLLAENAMPDFTVTSDGVMHIAWAANNGTDWDIHYRNAWLEED